MAGVKLRFVTPLLGSTGAALPFTNTLIAQLITASHHAVVVTRVQLDIDGDGRATTPACRVTLNKMADGTDGTMTTLAAVNLGDDPETIQTVCRHYPTSSYSAPTTGAAVDSRQVMVAATGITTVYFNYSPGLKIAADEGFGVYFDDGLSSGEEAIIGVTIDFEE
jgi:hypothetical protein